MKISRAQTVDEEMDRLLVLKSYMILDSDCDKHFERLTGISSRIFEVPIALVSLVDLGRQWFMSNHGLGDVRETPRKMAFCSHAIQSADDFLIVPDATKDTRFENNPLVTAPPHIRFYAGAPLLTPEGCRLGTLCIIDTKPRPHGLTIHEKQNLFELSALVMEEMERLKDERTKLALDKTRILAGQAHDLMTPLAGTERALSQLEDFDGLGESNAKYEQERENLMKNAIMCLDTMRRICLDAISEDATGDREAAPVPLIAASGLSCDKGKVESDEKCEHKVSQESVFCRPVNRDVCNIPFLVQKLQCVLKTYPKTVPLVITVDPKVPEEIICDDLKIFRSALNYLTNALDQTQTGSVQLRVYVKEVKKGKECSAKSYIVFECKDTGAGVSIEVCRDLFYPTGKAGDPGCGKLAGVGGTYGFYQRKTEDDPMEMKQAGVVFWFSVPLVVPYSSAHSSLQKQGGEHTMATTSNENQRVKVLSLSNLGNNDRKHVYDVVSSTMEGGSEDEEEINPCEQKNARVASKVLRRALVIDDSLIVRKSIGRALVRLGFDVNLATNGMEGLKMLQSFEYDVVFCDVLMPFMGGLECVKQYRAWEEEHRPSFRQHIIGLSAHDSDDVLKEGIGAGMNAFMPKSKKLSEVLSQALAVLETPDGEGNQAEERRISRRKIKWEEITKGDCDFPLRSLGVHSACSSLSPGKRAAFSAGVASFASPNCRRRSCQPLCVNQGVSCTTDQDASSPVHPILTRNFVIAPIEKRDDTPGHECLIAEDSLKILKVLIKAVEGKVGWKAKVVNDGVDALRLLKTRKWDAVLIDEDMPSISGTKCIAKLRSWETEQARTDCQRNVFLVSAHFASQQGGKCTAMLPTGVDSWLAKPVCIKDVDDALENAARICSNK